VVGAQDARLGVASQSGPKHGRCAANLTRVSLPPFQPQVCFPVQLKLQMVRQCSHARLVPRTSPGAIADSVRDPAALDCNDEPLSGVLTQFALLRREHLVCLSRAARSADVS